MKGMVRGGLTVTILAAAMAAAPTHASANAFCRYEPAVLPLPAGFSEGGVDAGDGNDWYAGWLAPGAGSSTPSVGRWHNGVVESIGTPFGGYAEILGVNASGVVVGAAYDPSSGVRAVVHRGSGWETLPAPGRSSRASDVNTAGDIVGVDANLGDGNKWNLLVVWPENGPRKTLNAPPGGGVPSGNPRIDDDGTVVATFSEVAGHVSSIASYIYPNGVQTGTRLAPLKTGDGTYITDIRNGRVVGENYGPTGTTTGVEWNRSGAVVRTIPGRPRAVSQSGAVTGLSEPDFKAAVWQSGSRGAALPGPAGRPYAFPAAFSGERVVGHAYGGMGGSAPVIWSKTC